MQWMADHYCCTLRQALRVFLPAPPWKSLKPKEEQFFQLIKTDAEVRGARQRDAIDALRGREWVSKSELKQHAAVSAATIKGLLSKGIIAEEKRLESPAASVGTKPNISEPSLTKTQENECEEISSDKRPSLLFGITGSGKTEIYAQLIADAVRSGKQAILLVPEILLTEHCIHRFQELLGSDAIEMWHSRLTPAQRRQAWLRINNGAVSLVIGSRSALFAPLPNLGLVILDEEHEWTYKNEQTPRYHARETAEAMCRFAGAKLVLGSATPSLESWARAKSGTYHLARLPERYGEHPLPNVRVIDLAQVNFGSLYPFSPPLLEAISERLQRKEQSILFLNRRGVATALLCMECRRRIVSPASQLPFTMHKNQRGEPYLVDHTSGITCPMPKTCPSCGSARLHAVGAGTQRVEDLLKQQFPNARLLRADSDTMTHPEHMRLLLKKMREGQADILLGTQSVVKGLDLPNVTLAAVLLADIGLSLPHFRAGERVFQLLTQLTGRSGRSQPGNVIIQTYRPEASEISLAATHDTERFLDEELQLRTYAGYPPVTNMVRLIIRENANVRAKTLCSKAQKLADEQNLDLTVNAAPLLFGGGREWHVLIRGAEPKKLLSSLQLKDVIVDVDPIECV